MSVFPKYFIKSRLLNMIYHIRNNRLVSFDVTDVAKAWTKYNKNKVCDATEISYFLFDIYLLQRTNFCQYWFYWLKKSFQRFGLLQAAILSLRSKGEALKRELKS